MSKADTKRWLKKSFKDGIIMFDGVLGYVSDGNLILKVNSDTRTELMILSGREGSFEKRYSYGKVQNLSLDLQEIVNENMGDVVCRDTRFIYCDKNDSEVRVFSNDSEETMTHINRDFISLFGVIGNSIGIEYKKKIGKYTPISIFKDGEFQGLIMPIRIQDEYNTRFQLTRVNK